MASGVIKSILLVERRDFAELTRVLQLSKVESRCECRALYPKVQFGLDFVVKGTHLVSKVAFATSSVRPL